MKRLSSFEILKSYSPFDLKGPGAIAPQRVGKLNLTVDPLALIYATERVDEKIVSSLFDLANQSKAIDKMRDMQSGKVINFIAGVESEMRKVLHTAARDFRDKTAESKLAFKEINKLKNFLPKVDRFTTVVQIGIGGSELGPRALFEALRAYSDKKAYFISNVDPDDAVLVLKEVDLEKTLFISVSKSGTTLETIANERIVREALEKKGLFSERQMVAVTGEKSPMDNPKHYLESFYIWDWVGGRFSATSMVGGVLLAFTLGFDNFIKILKGAHTIDQNALLDSSKNLPLLAALLGIWNRNFLNLSTTAIIPYSQALRGFILHLQQLGMESNGKSVKKDGSIVDYPTCPIIWGEVGTNCQHSFFQLLHQGTELVPIEFISFSESQYGKDLLVENTTSHQKLLSNLVAQSIALAEGEENKNPNRNFPGNRPSSILHARKLDPYTMGSLLAFYEHKFAFQGFIWDINSFDQEGVQLGKRLTKRVLDSITEEKKYELGDAFLNLL